MSTKMLMDYLPFVAPVLLVVYSFAQQKWFWLHVASMASAFLVLSPFSARLKRAGGYKNTKNHGIMLGAALAIGCFGWYVIHSNKNMLGKEHLTSWHGMLGALVMVIYIGMAPVSSFFIDPDWGLINRMMKVDGNKETWGDVNKKFRFVHKYSGRGAMLLGLFVSYLGYIKMFPEMVHQALGLASVASLAWVILLAPAK